MPIQNIRYTAPKPFTGFTGFNDLVKEEEKPDPQQQYLDALEKSKTTLKERAPFLLQTPDKPTMDKERLKNYKNLTKAGAIAQLVDALGDVALGARNKDYRPVASNADELAFSGMQQVYNMDTDFRNQLRNYENDVFQIGNKNRQITGQINQQNELIDLEKAKANLDFEQDNARVAALKEKAEYDKLTDTNKRYFDSGLRLISQGEEESAMVMLEKAGLDTKKANELLGRGEKTDSVTSRLNNYMGYDGKKKSVSKLQLNMLEQHRAIEKAMAEEPNPEDYDWQGKPKSQRAKKLEALGEELGPLRFVPEDMLIEEVHEKATGKEEKATVMPEEVKDQIIAQNLSLIEQLKGGPMTPEQIQPIAEQLFDNGAKLGLTQEQVQQELDTILNPDSDFNRSQVKEIPGVEPITEPLSIEKPEDMKRLQQYGAEIRQAFLKAEDNEAKAEMLRQLGQTLESAGMSDEDITTYIEAILGEEEKPTDEQAEGLESGFLGRDIQKGLSAIDKHLKGTSVNDSLFGTDTKLASND